jgi:acyl carrier protein
MEYEVSAKETYDNVFVDCFGVDASQLNAELTYQSIEEWDSVGHMAMVAQLEDAFGIMLEMDDIIDFASYTVGIETLKKYGIEI